MISNFIIRHWKGVGVLALIIITVGWIKWQSYQISILQDELITATTALQTSHKTIEDLSHVTQNQIKALETEHLSELERLHNLARQLEDISHTDESNDGAVAPVLRDALNRLYQNPTNAD